MSEPNPNSIRHHLSMMRKAWSGCLEIPIEWLGRSNSGPLSELYTFYGVSALLQSLGEEQIKPICVDSEEQTLRMLNVYDPLPEFLESTSIQLPEDVEEHMEINTLTTLRRSALLMKFPFGACTDPSWSLVTSMAMHATAFFSNVPGTTNRESVIGGPLRAKTSENTSGMEFAVMINRYDSHPHSVGYDFAREHRSPSLADQSLNQAFCMQITPTHPALIVGRVEGDEVFTPMNKKRIL
ncbi:hypothetical protein Clacol_004835 [Clathrus columnatus]|uniref:Uncharacterized protein n=1 Tax=Clathrus columnatus TaxID=1419009 RepID=A0AAV5AAV6_9AGAM|nr:hypothetical protein Clacol_004835 [Clathrus columnatus]